MQVGLLGRQLPKPKNRIVGPKRVDRDQICTKACFYFQKSTNCTLLMANVPKQNFTKLKRDSIEAETNL